jgi:hypothetical protein
MRTAFVMLALAGAMTGCNSAPNATRSVIGQIVVDTAAMSKPVVVATGDHRVFVAEVARSGRFTLKLPTNVSYRVTLASTAAEARYNAVARINWPESRGPALALKLLAGDTLDLGHVYRRGTKPSGFSSLGGDAIESYEVQRAHLETHANDYDLDADRVMDGAEHGCDGGFTGGGGSGGDSGGGGSGGDGGGFCDGCGGSGGSGGGPIL